LVFVTASYITQTGRSTVAEGLSQQLVERILARLGFNHSPAPTIDALCTVYSAWCERVPFDNIRKLIHVRAANAAPLPGSTPEDFFEAWLKLGTGGTCWPGAGALHAFLDALGFDAARAIGTMMAAPNLPPITALCS
jgi:N-hydroxyarylamine O-acetyltransferase